MVLENLDALRATWRADGCLKLPGVLDAEALGKCRKLFDETFANPWKIAPPGPTAYNDATGFRGEPHVFGALLRELPALAQACAEIWDSKSVWFYDMEIFHKTDTNDPSVWERPHTYRGDTKGIIGKDRATQFHRDTSGVPYWGPHIGNLWITFGKTPKEHSLQMVAGSYSHGKLGGEVRLKETIVGGGALGEIQAFDTEPGDVVMLHPGTLHGGGTVSPEFRERNTLVLRVFGDDCVYRDRRMSATDKRYQGMNDGDHFSLPGHTRPAEKGGPLHPLVWGKGDVPAPSPAKL